MKLFKKTTMGLMVSATCLGLAGSSVGADASKISDNVIRIGVLTDMAGPYALVGGADSSVAARMAIEDFGKTQINGARIELLAADDQNRTDVAAARTKLWIEKDHVDMITGFVATTAALGAMSEGAKHKIPVFVASATSTGITNASCNAFTVHWMQDTYGLSAGTVKSLIEQGKKTWFFITADYSFGYALERDASALVRSLGGEVKGAIKAPFPSFDFTEQLKAAQESGAQVIAFANSGLDAVGATDQAVKLGLDKKQLVAPLLLFHQDVQLLGAPILQDKFITIGYVWNQTPESIEFAKRFYIRTHRMPDVNQAGVYSSVLQYLKAVEATGSDSGEEIMKYLKSPTTRINDAIIKDGYVRADGKMMKPMYLIRIKKPTEMANEWDYYDVKKVISADDSAIPADKSTCPLLNKNIAKAAVSAAPASSASPAPTAASVAAPVGPSKAVENGTVSSKAVPPATVKK